MSVVRVVVAGLTVFLGACSVVGVVSDVASVTGTVVSTTVSVAGDAVDAAASAVKGSDDEKKPQPNQ